MSKVRVRFAPSPTGPLHIGGVRTALYNYLYAKKHGGDFILRIEDTDQNRFVSGAEQYIIDSLNWLGIVPNEGVGFGNGEYGPYHQSQRKSIYLSYAQQMLKDGKAYYAFDSSEELEAVRKDFESEKKTFSYDASTRMNLSNSLTMSDKDVESRINAGDSYVIRIKINPEETIHFNDLVRGPIHVEAKFLDDKVLYKSDGLPTYHLANIVDDYLMKITHVIRGEEWLPSAPLHVLLYRYLGWEKSMPEFAHLPLILKPEGKGKLSKRDGDRLGFPVFPLTWKDPVSGEISEGYKEAGYLPEALNNLLAMLGWNSGTEQEIFSLQDLIDSFSLERVGKSGARFDPDKAKWFNAQYLIHKTGEEIAKIHPQTKISIEQYIRVCDLMKERVTFPFEILTKGNYFFQAPTAYDSKTLKKKWKDYSPQIVNDLISVFKTTEWLSEHLEHAFKNYLEQNELGYGTAMIALRLVITGEGGGPELFDVMEIIGKEESLKRMEVGVKSIKAIATI